MTRTNGLLFIWVFGLCSSLASGTDDTCSVQKYLVCHEDADCIEENGVFSKCVCKDGLVGDGLKGIDNTGCGEKKCSFDLECHTLAVCNSYEVCECLPGYSGDGNLYGDCVDVNECLENPCHPNADCENTPGSYNCTCQMDRGYYGDGYSCSHTCSMDYDCAKNEKCIADVCVCKDGYELVGYDCTDIDECALNPCDPNAACNNTIGSYACTCNSGYRGNGRQCDLIPTNCHDIIVDDPDADSGNYEIDPDGEGPLEPIMVECEMRPGLGITIIPHTGPNKKRINNRRPKIDYNYEIPLEPIRKVIDGSGYCYQEMSYKAVYGATLMDGNDYWLNGQGLPERNWGGSEEDGMCACGFLGYCDIPGNLCNANGTEEEAFDTGKILKKEKLPIRQVYSKPGRGFAEVKIGPLMCSPKPFDIPIDCHDAKFNNYYKIRKDGPQVLDFDGPDGPLEPILAHCDMQSHKHVGTTVIPHKSTDYVTPNQPGENFIDYNIEHEHLDKLVEISAFCSQEAEYECTNSGLMGNGANNGFFTDSRGDQKNYWPGGLGEANQCGCGLLQVCDSVDVSCNCDIKDGKTRKDFGKVIDKDDLPIAKITLNEIGGGSSGRYKVGPLKCSQYEFGISPTCRDYVDEGFVDSYTYLVDPDGPEVEGIGSIPPFPVYCEFKGDPLYAVTVVYHEYRYEVDFINAAYGFIYIHASLAQLEALITRSVSCTQSIKFSCKKAPINEASGSQIVWETRDGETRAYFAGDGTKSAACTCGQTEPSSCVEGLDCNCDIDDDTLRHDIGLITNKLDLPIINIESTSFAQSSTLQLEVGPLECQEYFPNCADLKVFEQYQLISENSLQDGEYIIDPDGALGVEPFKVTCTGTRTTLPVDTDPTDPTTTDPDNPGEGVDKCYTINYMSPSGNPVTPEQALALVENSKFCSQSLTQTCLNAPLTDHTTFTTCDGVEQPGWAGSGGEDMCACGVVGSCAGGPDAKCNCDLENDQELEDTGTIVDKDRLPVCEICVSLDPPGSNSTDEPPKTRIVQPKVSALICDLKPVGTGTSCQNWRDQGILETKSLMIDMDEEGPLKPFPTQCVLSVYPPLGVTEVYPKEPEVPIPNNGTTVEIEYFVFEMEFIYKLIEESRYCTQDLFLECQNSNFTLAGTYGWYSRDGERQAYWAGNEEGTTGCAGGECQCNLGGVKLDGGVIIDDTLLPVTRVIIGPGPEDGYRKLKIGPVKCFDLYRDCHEIKRNRAVKDPLGNDTYAIDPDQGGGVDPFAVVCDFKTNKRIGITIVPVVVKASRIIRGVSPPQRLEIPVKYDSVDYDQIHALATISSYCHQGVQYLCYNSPLTDPRNPDSGYYDTYGGVRSPSYGVAGDSDTDGCACMATKTCPVGNKCHCDAVGQMTVDYGNEIDRDRLPITLLEFGGQKKSDASAMFEITDVRCGPKPFDLPRDCQDVYDRGLRSGEHLILPSTRAKPFLVYCDLKILTAGGVTIIGNDREEPMTVTYGETVEINYHNVDKYKWIEALVEISKYCFQPFKYECTNTVLLRGEGYFYWQGKRSETETYVGSGDFYSNECNCGKDGYCGGSENKTELVKLFRPCNCDSADDEERADAGIFNSTVRLPMKEFTFKDTGIAESQGVVTLGKLYCAQDDFDLNECSMGFHDCHVHAKCINTFGSYECRCKSGWQGRGRPDVWANGRNCYDDDECAMNYCPWSATCTNLDGSFECNCKEGFTQIGKRRCKDIDECKENTHNCHENARCINLEGSFDCRCNRNFRGNGTSCEPLALCACFGDPHCMTSDGKFIDYQGQCQYIMSRDKCEDLASEPTYQLLTTFKPKPNVITENEVTWVREVKFKIYNYTIDLMQDNEIRVNGFRRLYYRDDRISIRRYGKNMEVHTDIGIELSWDGDEVIEIYTPGQFGGTTCGLCGNYNGNKEDDLVVGPGCPETGAVTDSDYVFGESWVVAEYVDDYPECAANCSKTEEPDLCDGMDLNRATLACDKVFSMNGIFKECLLQMDDEEREEFRRSCIYDACEAVGDMEEEVCESAAFLVRFCKNQYGVIVTKFRSEEFCQIQCGENMEYHMCGPMNQPNCLDIRTGATPLSNPEECQEGCFCKEGYIMDGEKCVLPEECGCYILGVYVQAGDVLVFEDCSKQLVCGEDGEFVEETIECHENANCESRDGVHGCHCVEGYYGNGIDSCVLDPCNEDPCEENEICVRNDTLDEGYICECEMGYIGDCGNCTEIDECETATYDCPENSACENTIGSYNCRCVDGYFAFGGKCEDVDECEMAEFSGEAVCGNNSKCANKIGSYECLCCSGYEKDENGECVESTSTEVSEESPKCCVCSTAICDRPGKVCGEDGEEYENIREMILSNCERGVPLQQQTDVDYYGKCRDSCGRVDCPLYQECVMKNGKPTCECEPCTVEESESEPVCTSKLDVYPNLCIFKKVQCFFDAEATPLDTMIPCEGKGQGPPVSEWSDWSECSVTCGNGTTTKTREQFVPMTEKQKEKFPLTAEAECYGPPCPDGPCDEEMPCPNPAAVCFEGLDGEKICECPNCEHRFDPVCGYLASTFNGVVEASFKSECHLREQACLKNIPDYEVMHKGPCGEEPLNCTRVPYSDFVYDDDKTFVSERKVNLFDCDGGCGRLKKYCCQPSEYEELEVTVKRDDEAKFITVQVVKACECVDLSLQP